VTRVDGPEEAEHQTPVWRLPGMMALVVVSLTGFAGYAALLPVAPLWAVHGGANEAGSGLVNGVLLLATIATQLFVPAALRRFGWRPVLAAGMVLLGVPALLYVTSDALGPVLAFSAVRGAGFGVLTVTGSAAAGLLAPPSRRGEAIGIYGLAVAVPNLLLLPAGPWLADNLGYAVVFVISAAPVLGVPAAIALARAVEAHPQTALEPAGTTMDSATPPARDWAAYRALLPPAILLLGVTLAGGAVLTFTPQMVSSPVVTTAGLFVMGFVAALTRWGAGLIADRHGAHRFVWPLVIVTAAGMALVSQVVRDPGAVPPAPFLVGMALVGLGYGALQNLTLVISFASVSRAHHNLASAVWNVGFDAGTGIGSVLVGALALRTSFPTAILVAGALTFVTLPLAVMRARRP
jgi:MFS family permease